MNAATKPAASQPGAHLRLVSDPAGSGTTGIRLSGVSIPRNIEIRRISAPRSSFKSL